MHLEIRRDFKAFLAALNNCFFPINSLSLSDMENHPEQSRSMVVRLMLDPRSHAERECEFDRLHPLDN